MTEAVATKASPVRSFRLGHILAFLAVLVVLRAVLMQDKVNGGYSDNLMRLVQVRDWLGGQGWFDLFQHRLQPPDGVSMHWSRYPDAGIAALLVPLSWLMPMAEAEVLTAILWPTLLLLILCATVASGSNRLFGVAAALGAGLVAVFWSKLGPGKFAPGAFDHHNVQLLLSTMALFLAVVPSINGKVGPAGMGALSGLATAFSLAVGLEMVPMLFLLWGLAALRFAWGVQGSAAWLTGFALMILGASPLLMAGQTAPSEWLVPYCDELATPMLAVIAAGAAASLAGVALGQRTASPLARFALMAGVAGIGLWLAAPLAGPCLSGPYGAMPEEARRIITERIAEAQPAWRSFQALPYGVNALMTPAIVITLLSAALGWRARHSLSVVQRQALILALAPAVIGIALSMIQIRALAVAAPSLPLLGGFVAQRIWAMVAEGRYRQATLLGIATSLLVLVPEVPLLAVFSLTPKAEAHAAADSDSDAWRPLSGSCRGPDTLAELDGFKVEVAPGTVVLSELNFGAMILAHTPFSATSAGYHRSANAFLHGVVPFQSDAEMVAAIRESGAGYVVICRPGGGGGPYGAKLLDGDLPPWLVPAEVPQKTLLLLRVETSRLPAATNGGSNG